MAEKQSADIVHDLKLKRDAHPVAPLFKGKWEQIQKEPGPGKRSRLLRLVYADGIVPKL